MSLCTLEFVGPTVSHFLVRDYGLKCLIQFMAALMCRIRGNGTGYMLDDTPLFDARSITRNKRSKERNTKVVSGTLECK